MSSLLEYDMNISCSELGQQDTQCMYNIKLRRFSGIIVVAEKQ